MSKANPEDLEDPASVTVAEAYGEVLKNQIKNIHTDEELEEIYSIIDELVEKSKYGPESFVETELSPEEIYDMHSSATDW